MCFGCSFVLHHKTLPVTLCRDPNTIFRGNSLTSKCIDETMKLAGMHYLQVTLKPIIDEVWQYSHVFLLYQKSKLLVFRLFLCLNLNHVTSYFVASLQVFWKMSHEWIFQ